ncbi:hypothetical protein [Halorarius litoreus]|uniref:hypothetical protein n=1 Tax=Halorarius litoreus TaxID=2962676 RepID=UPI0020CC6D87|nr:hypothetical protein [Halorarius litoreus]
MTKDTRDTDARTLGEMSHTNPYTNETFGDTQTYNRGQVAAADGGEDGAPVEEVDDVAEPDDDEQTMQDVDHTPPKNAPSANAAYMAGDENAEE